ANSEWPVAPPPTAGSDGARAAMLAGVRLGPVFWRRLAIIPQYRERNVAWMGAIAPGRSLAPPPAWKMRSPALFAWDSLASSLERPKATSYSHPRDGVGHPSDGEVPSPGPYDGPGVSKS